MSLICLACFEKHRADSLDTYIYPFRRQEPTLITQTSFFPLSRGECSSKQIALLDEENTKPTSHREREHLPRDNSNRLYHVEKKNITKQTESGNCCQYKEIYETFFISKKHKPQSLPYNLKQSCFPVL